MHDPYTDPTTWESPEGLTDDLGGAILEYLCPRCAHEGATTAEAAEIYKRHHRPLLCLACEFPNRFAWSRNPETGREFLRPILEEARRV